MIFKDIKKSNLLIVILIFIGAFLPFLMSINNQFISDDWNFLDLVASQEKPIIDNFSLNTFGERGEGSYRPMVNIFWVINYRLWRLNSFGFHLSSLFFHALSAVLIFFLVKESRLFGVKDKERKLVAILSSLVFITWPSHAVAGCWISVVNDTMMTTFVLLSWYLLLKAQRVSSKLFYFISILFFILAVFTKEMSVTVPFLMFFWVFVENRLFGLNWKNFFKTFYLVLPYFLVLVIYFWLRFWVTGFVFSNYVHGGANFTLKMFWHSVAGNISSLFLSGEIKNFVLYQLFNYPLKFGIIILIALVILALFSIKRRSGLVNWMLLGFLIFSLLPIVRFAANYTGHYFSAEGERFVYFPSVFAALLAGILLRNLYIFLAKYKYLKYLWSALVPLILFTLCSQLVNKNFYWKESSKVANNLIDDWKNVEESNGYFVVGVPDNYHGSFVFRNGLESALYLKYGLDKKSLLVTRNRTLFSSREKFDLERITKKDFVYKQESVGNYLIAGEVEVSSFDYNSVLNDPHKEVFSIAYQNFSSSTDIHLSDEFIKYNIDNKISMVFFNGFNWNSFDL